MKNKGPFTAASFVQVVAAIPAGSGKQQRHSYNQAWNQGFLSLCRERGVGADGRSPSLVFVINPQRDSGLVKR